MSLNKTEGEILGSWGRGVVAETEKWANVMGFMEVASNEAQGHFASRGVPIPMTFTGDNILVQEFHLHDSVVFIFWIVHRGQDLDYTYTVKLGVDLRQQLALAGRWPAIHAMPADVRAN